MDLLLIDDVTDEIACRLAELEERAEQGDLTAIGKLWALHEFMETLQ